MILAIEHRGLVLRLHLKTGRVSHRGDTLGTWSFDTGGGFSSATLDSASCAELGGVIARALRKRLEERGQLTLNLDQTK